MHNLCLHRPTSCAPGHVPHHNLLLNPAITALEALNTKHEPANTTNTQTVRNPHFTISKTPNARLNRNRIKMPSAKFTQTYEKVSKMGEKLKAAGKQGPSNDEQLKVRLQLSQILNYIP
jgi:hypothetical protein